MAKPTLLSGSAGPGMAAATARCRAADIDLPEPGASGRVPRVRQNRGPEP